MECVNITSSLTLNDCAYVNTDVDQVNNSDDTKHDTKWLQENFNRAEYVICPLLFVIGITGNLMTILTVTRPQFRQLTSRYILCVLAISDSLLLFTNPFNQQFMPKLVGQDIRALSRTGCKIFFIAYRIGKLSSSWFIVMISVERCVAVWFPLKVKRIITKKSIAFAIVLVYISMGILSSMWTFSSEVVKGVCVPDAVTPENLFLHKRFVMAAAVCYSIAPIVILFIFTPPVIMKLSRRKNLHSNAISRFARETNRITVMLVAIVVMFVICVTPITLVLVLTFWTNEPIFGSNKKEYIILTAVAQLFEQLNHSMNFILYVLFSRQFRTAFLKMISRRKTSRDSTFGSSRKVCTSQTEFENRSFSAD